MELDLKQLREIAEAPGVRPGSWNVYDRGVGYEVHDEKGCELTGGMRETFDKADATHIATFDPPTVLALLSRLEQAEANFDEADSLKIANESAIERVRELHYRFAQRVGYDQETRQPIFHYVCEYCSDYDTPGGEVPYPCDTIEALDGEQDG